MTDINISECFSVSLLPSDSLKYLANEIETLYIPYADKVGSNLGGVLQSVKECITSSGSQPFDSDESTAPLTRVSDEFDYWKRY